METVNGMTDVVFGVKDLITIGGGVVATVTAYLTLKLNMSAKEKADEKRFSDIEHNHTKEISELKQEHKEQVMSLNHGKNAIKKELEIKIDKLEEMTKSRIDKTQERMEKLHSDNQLEFKEINAKLNQILGFVKK